MINRDAAAYWIPAFAGYDTECGEAAWIASRSRSSGAHSGDPNHRPRTCRLHQPALHHGRLNEGCKQRMRFERSRLQFGMKLHPNEPGVVLVFNDFRQHTIRRKTGEFQPVLLEAVFVGGVDLVTMAVALRYFGGAAINIRHPTAPPSHPPVRPQAPWAAPVARPGA